MHASRPLMSDMKRFWIILLFGIGVSIVPRHVACALDEDFQAWLLTTATGPTQLSDDLRWYVEVQPRVGRDMEHIERLLLRTALTYRFAGGWSLWAGYAWTPTFHNAGYKNVFEQEHRVWSQAQHEEKYDLASDMLRIRLEQRFIDGVGSVSNRLRILYRLSSNDPIVLGTRLTGYNELFLNLNETSGPRSGFDRNRLFLGPYWTDGMVRIEAGYINEFSDRKGLANRIIHALLMSVGFTF